MSKEYCFWNTHHFMHHVTILMSIFFTPGKDAEPTMNVENADSVCSPTHIS